MSCDSTVSPSGTFENTPKVTLLTITPNTISFVPSDGFRDTTMSIYIESTIEDVDAKTIPGYVIRKKSSQELIASGELSADNQANIFTTEINLETTTTTFEEYIFEVYAYNSNGSGNFFQTLLSIEGFSNNPPEILEAINPEEVQRPQSGQISVSFTAKTTDLDGQDTIEGVFLRLISRISGESSGSPFLLYDDGANQSDAVANDSVFTATFPVSSSNQLQTYDIFYYAVDKGGLVSDTVKTTFSIIE